MLSTWFSRGPKAAPSRASSGRSKRGRRRRLSLESLEPRIALSASTVDAATAAVAGRLQASGTRQIRIVSGKTRLLRDGDGSLVRVLLSGPGSGFVTLTNGKLTGGAIDTISLSGTTGQSRLSISSVGGRVSGTTVGHLAVRKAASARSGLAAFNGASVDLATGGTVEVDGGLGTLAIRSIGDDADVTIASGLGRLTAGRVGSNFALRVAGDLGTMTAQSLASGAFVSAGGGIASLTVRGALGKASRIEAGHGGIGKLTVGGLDTSVIYAHGPIGDVVVNGDMRASSIVSKVAPGRDGQFGTDDDLHLHGEAQGGIGSIRVAGTLKGSDDSAQTYGIVTFASIGTVTVGGRVINQGGRGQSDDGRVKVVPGPPPALGADQGPDFAVADYMGWGDTAPTYSENVSYTSSPEWETLNIINYSPSHYARVGANGQLLDNNNQPLADPSFQAAIGTDFPDASTRGTYMSYLLGNPEITVYDDLKQLQNAGFDGVRLYDVPAKVAIATIQAAYQLSHEPGSKGAFYVDYEVATPDLSKEPYIGTTGKSVAERTEALFENLVATTPVSSSNPGEQSQEGAFERLHYVINMVGPAVFSEVVPVVFFGHENLVSPTTLPDGTKLDDDNTSTPLLRWGINATRELLKKELAGHDLPAVTNALLAGQVIQVSTFVHPEVATLIEVIQTDPNAPIAYDNYPFQWGNTYFNTPHDYVNDGVNIIEDAYPVDSGGQKITYIDRTVVDGAEWTSGPPPIAPAHTPADAVTKADLFWSLQWIKDRVDWIWGHLEGHPDGKAKQLIAETGWASDQIYQPPNGDGSPGKEIHGNLADAKAYYEAVAAVDFHVDGAPVMYFDAYDEPVKNSDPHLLSENHYGIFRWTGIPKFAADDQMHPLTGPFAILAVAPFTDGGTPQSVAGESPTATAYTIKKNGKVVQSAPWFRGGNTWSDGVNGRTLYLPNPNILLADGDIVEITPTHPNPSLPAAKKSIKLKYAGSTDTLSYVTPIDFALDKPDRTLAAGSKWQLNTSFDWYHPDNDFPNQTKYPKVFQDFWAKPRT